MSVYIFQMDGINPVGGSHVSGNVAPPGTLECTEAQSATFGAAKPHFPGTDVYQFEYDGTTLTQLTDSRVTATWGHTPGSGVEDNDGDWEFELGVGDPEPSVTVTLSVGLTDPKRLVRFLPSGHLLSLNMNNGAATLVIKTDKPTKYEINENVDVRFTNSLRVWVREVDLYAV